MELYIHIPFCRQKCRYCSFVSFTGQENNYEAYIDLLLKEASLRTEEVCEPIRTVYIGGGTPSLLPSFLFTKLLMGLNQIIDLRAVTEFTAEANPGTVDSEWLDIAVRYGINRLSFGLQAGQDRLLRLLGRIHTMDDVAQSVHLARKAGISNISLDLIFGLPTQEISEWNDTLAYALSLEPLHISAYGLIPEEGTPLFDDLQNQRISLPDPDTEREMYGTAVSILQKHGFQRYEISNFARKGYECIHNIGYWTQVPYIGLGVSAASMTELHDGPEGLSYRRRTNPETLKAYRNMIDGRFVGCNDEQITPEAARFETMMLSLRMSQGISEEIFLKKHRISLEQCYGIKLNEMEKNGLMLHENGRWKLTDRGFDIQNSILVELME